MSIKQHIWPMTLQLNSQEKNFNLTSFPVFIFFTYFSLLFNIFFFLNRVTAENEEESSGKDVSFPSQR